MDAFLWVIGSTALIAIAGYVITIFVIHPIQNLQEVSDQTLRLLIDYADVYGVARDNQKYQAREAFRQSVSRLKEAKLAIPLYWLWGILGPVPTQQNLFKAETALLKLADLSVQIIDHQADLSKRQAERARVIKEAADQEKIIKASIQIKDHPLFRDP